MGWTKYSFTLKFRKKYASIASNYLKLIDKMGIEMQFTKNQRKNVKNSDIDDSDKKMGWEKSVRSHSVLIE